MPRPALNLVAEDDLGAKVVHPWIKGEIRHPGAAGRLSSR